ncbi:MAG: hypothetical protein HQK86_11110 [Nitrospinae bacterium]|nr:hypothetical protein [Nitrospinota bacterium]MBF0633032.1 hypothetical protein [Nitrospinota bacterium]
MRAFLNLLGLAGAMGVTTALVLGYLTGFGFIELTTHIGVGLLSPAAPMLAFSITLFYFIATGKAIGEAAQKGHATEDDVAATRGFKAKLFPWLLAAMIALMAAPLSGAAFDTGKLPRYAHSIIAWASLAVLWLAWWKASAMLRENSAIMAKTAKAIRGDSGKMRNL